MKLAYDLYLPRSGDGNRDLSPVIFLHGRMDSKRTWKKFAPKIADRTGREVYTLDARNHGESPWSAEMNFDVLTSDLEEFMTDHSIPQAILIGHSLGGRTAITLALRKANTQLKESRVFELDTLPIKREGDSYAWEANLDVLEDMLMTEKCDQQLSGVYEGDALFLYGTDSFFDILGDKGIEKYFPTSCKVPVQGAGHLIHHDFPEDFLRHVLNFLCPSNQ